MNTVVIDWSAIPDIGSFYDSVLPQTGAPEWHGRNLNAIADAWVTGDICSLGPPFDFIVRDSPSDPEVISFSEAVEKIIQESVSEHGGTLKHELEN